MSHKISAGELRKSGYQFLVPQKFEDEFMFTIDAIREGYGNDDREFVEVYEGTHRLTTFKGVTLSRLSDDTQDKLSGITRVTSEEYFA